MSLTVTGRLGLKPSYSKAHALLASGQLVAPEVSLDLGFADGVGADQADKVYFAQRTLAASATENLDLAGVLTDVFGDLVTFVKVKLLYVRAAPGNTNNVEVGGHATAAFLGPFKDATDKVVITPGDFFLARRKSAGWPVTATTADMLMVTNSGAGTGVTYDVFIIGTSA